MCGIVGGYWRKSPANADALLADALAKLKLRGPDDRGCDVVSTGNGVVALGHARLSIIDVSSGGHQPMISADGRFALVFNGEIYNYRELREELRGFGHHFQSQSDSEVLLAAWAQWGSECLPKLDGMFAFVVHDRQRQRLVCARDGFGIKPLFFLSEPGRFLFASTQRALVALRGEPPRADWQRCYDYLVHGDYDGTESTFVAGVRQIPPGHLLEIDLTGCLSSEAQSWWIPRTVEDRWTFSDACEAVRETFLTNIRLQLRSDVPLGAALSGGVDSSAVVCAMRYVEPSADINTFSYIARGTSLDEEYWVDRVTAHVGARAYKVTADEGDLLRDLDDLIEAQGEPFGSTSIYAQYRVFHLAREHGVTVTLDGQGADELLAGYSGYPGFRLLSLLEQGRILNAQQFARAWGRWPNRSYRLAVMELGRVVFPDGLYAGARKALGRDFRPAWLDNEMLDEAGVRFVENRPPRSRSSRGRRVIEQLSKSLQQRGLPALLRHADRNSMRFSVESRVPFLTNGFADLLLSMPESFLVSPAGETKSVFRAAMRGIVPDEILDRRDKIGFGTPERDWLLKIAPRLRVMIAQDAPGIPFIREDALLAHFDAMLSGKIRFSWQLWRWVNFVRWFAKGGIAA